jgi:hypothetical protein
VPKRPANPPRAVLAARADADTSPPKMPGPTASPPLATEVVTVHCPEGTVAGDTLTVDTGSNGPVEITVPQGVRGGENFRVPCFGLHGGGDGAADGKLQIAANPHYAANPDHPEAAAAPATSGRRQPRAGRSRRGWRCHYAAPRSVLYRE